MSQTLEVEWQRGHRLPDGERVDRRVTTDTGEPHWTWIHYYAADGTITTVYRTGSASREWHRADTPHNMAWPDPDAAYMKANAAR